MRDTITMHQFSYVTLVKVV